MTRRWAEARKDTLCADCVRRLDKNPLRILDSKDPRDRPIADLDEILPGLLELENVVVLPHLGSATIETRTAMGVLAARNASVWNDGGCR